MLYSIQLGKNSQLEISGVTAAEIGVPLVELRGNLEHLGNLTPEQADQIAHALTNAARIARGEPKPTALDQLLAKRA